MRKAERWRREVFRIFRALRLEKNSSTELFGESPNYSVCYRIIRYPTELFGTLPNYSVHRIIFTPSRYNPLSKFYLNQRVAQMSATVQMKDPS